MIRRKIDEDLRRVPRLIYNGLQLPNHQTLEESGILKGSTVEMQFCSENSFFVFLKTLICKTITIDCFPTELVYGLMRKIYDSEGVPWEQQRLIFRGKQLDELHSLHDYGVKNQVTIHLVLRLRGGGIMPPSDAPVSVGMIDSASETFSEESPPRLAAGATTLHGESSQEFGKTIVSIVTNPKPFLSQ
jgi:hypothetical protein